MAVYINHKEYEFIEEMSIFEYIRQYQIFLPSLDEKIRNICSDDCFCRSYVRLFG